MRLPVEFSIMASRKMSRPSMPEEIPPQRLDDAELNQVAGLLSRAVKFGQQSAIAKKMHQYHCSKAMAVSAQSFMETLPGSSSSAAGTMSDASKRQRDPAEEALQECWEHDMAQSWGLISSEPDQSPSSMIAAFNGKSGEYPGTIPRYLASVPVEPPMPGVHDLNFVFGEEDSRVPLPPDMPTVQDWARAELELDKVKRLKLCYGEFVRRAETDPQLRSYAGFLMDNYGPFVLNKKTKKYTKGVDFAFFLARIKFDTQETTPGLGFRRHIRQ